MLRSTTSELNPLSDEPKSESVTEFLLPGFLYTLATDKKSTDTFWCMKIEGGKELDQQLMIMVLSYLMDVITCREDFWRCQKII